MRTSLRLILILLGLPGCSFSSGDDSTNTVDKIAVVVGDQVILASELANQLQLAAFQSGQRPQTEAEIRRFQEQVLEQMISDQLFLAEAKKDTSITVRPTEVQQALDEHIARVVENFGSEEKFIAALEQEGMTLRDLRRQYEQDIENNLLRQRFIQKKLYDVSVSRVEVEKFFEEFKDSIPDQPEGVRLAHILLEVTPSARIEDSVKTEAALRGLGGSYIRIGPADTAPRIVRAIRRGKT